MLAGLPIARVRGPVDGDVAAFGGSCSPRQPSVPVGTMYRWWGQFRVAASQQNAASSRAQATATVPVCLPRRTPRCAQRPFRRFCARQAIATTLGGVLPDLTRGDRLTRVRAVAVVMGGFDEEPAGMRRAGLGDLAQHPFGVRGVLARHDSEEPRQQRGL